MRLVFIIALCCIAESAGIRCPSGCTCSVPGPSSPELVIKCNERIATGDVSAFRDLSDEINRVLSDENRTSSVYGGLKRLEIVKAALAEVPPSVCQMRSLEVLRLDGNRITSLPDDCFVRLPNLAEFSATYNKIDKLQDGLFDGLSKLRSIDLQSNRISSIGVRLFSNASDLRSLRDIILKYNLLQTLDTWPYARGLAAGVKDDRIGIDLSDNQISNFTNDAGLQLGCGKLPKSYATLGLESNKIRRVTDIMTGFGMTSFLDFVCATLNHGRWSFYASITGSLNYVCDCVDFDFYSLARLGEYNGFFYGVHCWDPPEMYLRDVSRIPLIEFVCDVDDGCPVGCSCRHRPANATMHIDCSTADLRRLPTQLPPLPKSSTRYKMVIGLGAGPLRVIEDRGYLSKCSVIDGSNSGLSSIEADAWKRLTGEDGSLQQLLLNGNNLTTLPRDAVTTTNISSRLIIRLDDNPWSCQCEDKWLAEWMRSASDRLLNSASILCNTPDRLHGKSLLSVGTDELCTSSQPPTSYRSEVIAGTLTAVVAAVVAIVALFLVKRWRVWLFSKFQFRDECENEDMEFDVFLCCSSEDHSSDAVAIVQRLESAGYRICYHLRDFLAGVPIMENIVHAVEKSKRTVCLLSKNFTQSGMCITEFETAFSHYSRIARSSRLILLMKLDSPSTTINDGNAIESASLRHYLRHFTYIDYNKLDWFDRLLYALPKNGILKQQQQQQQHDDAESVRLV